MANDRRSFIKKAAFYSGSLILPGCKTIGKGPISGDSFLKVSPVDSYIPKRVSWNALSESDKKAFIEAVKAMKGTEIPVPDSFGNQGERKLDRWMAQAECHQWHCAHRTWAFLPWHRSYLYYFERYLRKQIRDSFRLPYWDWSLDQEAPKELQDAGFVSTLGISRENLNIAVPGEAGADQTKEWWAAAFTEIGKCADYDTIGGDANSSGFIESPYHNMVHVGIGGDMGRVPFAGKDPIFWLHHCNIDRLWSLWMDQIINSGNTRHLFPSADVANWLNLSFPNHFWGPDNNLASATIKSSLFTEELGYNYDTMDKTWTITDIPYDQPTVEVPAPVKTVETTAPAGLRLAETPGSVLALQFSIPQIFDTPQKLVSLRLKVTGIPQPANSRLNYAVSLNVGSKTMVLPEIAFFPGSHHAEGAIGLSLNKHMEAIRAMAQGNGTGQLVLVLQDRNGKTVSIKEAVPNFVADPAAFKLNLKAVFA